MAILTILWTGTLCVIYSSSYLEVSHRNQEMLARHVELYMPKRALTGVDIPENGPGPGSGGPHFEDTPAFQLSTFYSVAISKTGEVLSITNPQTAVYDDKALEEMAREIIEGGKSSGLKHRLIYRMADKGGYLLVAFMDNTIMQESMTTLFRYTLIFGGLAILALFFLARYLAKKIVRPLEESYRKQKQFISDAGHELKTPVSVINANAELLLRQIGENRWLSNIQYENERMGVLVGQLLELARTEHTAPPMEPVELGRLAAGEALPFESVAFENGLKLSCEPAAGPIFVRGNSSQLKQLVAILLDNAIRHCSPGKEVFLTLKTERNLALLSVVNDGEEIPLSEQKQIFERFYRGDPARTEEAGRYGLGLAIAKAIVNTHHGRINVQCTKGKVIFAVSLPLLK